MDEYGHFSPFNDDINYTTMNSNALISIFHQSSHDYAHTKMTGIMIINRVDTNDSHRLKKNHIQPRLTFHVLLTIILQRYRKTQVTSNYYLQN